MKKWQLIILGLVIMVMLVGCSEEPPGHTTVTQLDGTSITTVSFIPVCDTELELGAFIFNLREGRNVDSSTGYAIPMTDAKYTDNCKE